MKRNRNHVLWIVAMLLLSSFVGIGPNAAAAGENVWMNGTVRNSQNGTAIPGAIVFLQNTESGDTNNTVTNATGFYNVSIFAQPFVQVHRISVIHEDYLTYANYLGLAEGTNVTDFDIYLDPADNKNSSVRGMVRDAITGAPLPFTSVIAFGTNYLNLTSTNVTGHYEMILQSDMEYYIQVSRDGYQSQGKVSYFGVGENKVYDFLLEPLNCTLSGYIKDPFGPLGTADVLVYQLSDPSPIEYRPRVNQTTGYFEINLTRGVWQVEVKEGGHFLQTLTVLMENGKTAWQNFTMMEIPAERANIYGWITYFENGTTAPDVEIITQNKNATWSQRNISDGVGYYDISVIPGDLTLRAQTWGYSAVGTPITTQAGGSHLQNLTLIDFWSPPTGFLEGYVRLNGTGEPDVYVMAQIENWRGEAITDGTGYYNISVPGAPLTVYAVKNGFNTSSAQVNTSSSSTTVQDLNLGYVDWSTEIRGYVDNTNGDDLGGAMFSYDYDGPGEESATAMTDYTGLYQRMAPSGTSKTFTISEGHEYTTGEADLPANSLFWNNETLKPVTTSSEMILRFTNIKTGKPIQNLKVSVSEMDLLWFHSFSLDSQGMFRTKVPSGFVRVSINARENGFREPGMFRDPESMQFRIRPGETRWLNISLYPMSRPNIYQGYVNDTSSGPISGAEVMVRFGDTILTNTTDASGLYSIRLPENTWFVPWVRAPGYRVQFSSPTPSMPLLEQDWVLENASAWIEGPVTDSVADLDLDLKYDFLYVNVTVNVGTLGNYVLQAELYEDRNSYQTIASDDVRLGNTLGPQLITLSFPGELIRNSEQDGYYVNIGLMDEGTWERLDSTDHFTARYKYTQFEIPDASIETPVDYWLVDSDLDGLFNYLIINVTLNVTVPGDYTIMSPIMDIWGNEFDMTFSTFSLEAGFQEVQLTFDGTSIYNNGETLGSVYLVLIEGPPTEDSDFVDTLYFYIPFDHHIFQFYEIDSFVSGIVTDIGGQPIEGLNVWLYNITQKYLNETTTNASGYFELGGWAGDWVLVVNDDEDISNVYDGDLVEITLSPGMTAHDFLNLPYIELDQVETQLIFSDWNNTYIDWLIYVFGDAKTLRFDLDVRQFGDGDGFLSEEEVETVLGFIGGLELPSSSNESFLVDGIWYDLEESSVTMDVGLVGSITSTDPVYIHMTGDYTANSSIPLVGPHDVTLNTSYDDTDSGNFIGNNVTHIVYISPPITWERTGNGIPLNVTISGSDYITIDALNDPNPGDSETWEWVNITVSAGGTPTTGTIKGNVTLQGGGGHSGVQVIIYINGTLTEVDKGPTNQGGYYEIPGLPAGNYDVVAHKAGYQDNWTFNIVLGAGETIWLDFVLYSFPPTIIHNPVSSAMMGNTIQVSADVSDDGAVDEVVLYYKDVGTGSYSQTTMTRIPSTNTYMGTIPAQVSLGFVYYYIWANDTKGNWITHPASGNHSIWIYELTPPDITSVSAIPDPSEYPESVNISALITDISGIMSVSMFIEYPDLSTDNVSMDYDPISGRYFSNTSYSLLGTYSYTIWANDSYDNWNSFSGSFEVLDTILPSSNLDLIVPYWFSTSPALITAQATDSGIGVENVELWFRHSSDNASWGSWSLFALDPAGPWLWNFDFPDGDGYYEFFAIANDSAGNSETMKVSAEAICAYDTTGPASSVSIISTYWQSTSPLVITATESDAMIGTDNIELWYRNSTDNATWSSWMSFGIDTGGPWTWDFTFPDGDGYYEFYSMANDSLGNSEPGKSIGETICGFDTMAPISSADVIPIYWHSTSPLVINATASDDLAGVTEVELYYRSSSDNASWGAWILFASDTSANWTWDFDFPGGDGYYEFYSIAYDAVGHAEAFKPSFETICGYDTIAPTSMINVTATYWISTSPIIITASATDDLIGTATVELWYRNSTDNSSWGAWTLFAGDASAPWSWDFDFPAGDGYYEFFSLSDDVLGNMETMKVAAEFICALDDTGPSSMVETISPYWQGGPSTTISASASDPSGVDRVTLWYRYSDDNSSWGSWSSYGTDTTSPWSFSFDYPDGDGYYQFYSIARDQLGNNEASKSSYEARLAIDTQVPTLDSITISPDPCELGEDITISISPTDVAGIAEAWIEITLGTTTIGNFSMTQSGPDYEHIYNPDDIGSASFVIWVSDNNGNWNTISGSVDVVDTEGPTISDFTIIPSVPEVGSEVTVTVNASDLSGISGIFINITDPDGNYVLNESMTLNPATGAYSHQYDYTILGDYTIEIWTVDGNGQTTLLAETITTIDNENPVADAGVDQQITPGTQVTLEGTGSSDNHLIVNYTWEFNDNGLTRLYGETVQYTFTSSGAFQITLRVRDMAGNTGEAKTWVNVSAVSGVGTISGTVLDKNGDPVEGAVVYVEGNPSLEDTTDSLGRYTIENVPVGQRTIIVVKNGYVRDSIVVDVEEDQTATPPPIALSKKSTEEESPMALIGILIAIIAIVIVLLLFLMTKKKPAAVQEETVIDEVFLMYNDGRLIKHFTRRLKPDMDEDILSSMLVAVQDFIKDSFSDQEGTLDEMNFGRFQVLLGRGEHIILATIVLGDDPSHLKPQVTQAVKDIEEKYADVLKDWDGEMQSIMGAAKYVMDLIDGKYAEME